MARSKRRQKRSPRSMLLGAGIAVVAGAFLFAALFMGDDEERPSVADVAGSPTVDGGLQPLPEGGDPDLGSPAPIVTGAGFDDEPVTIGESGTPQMVVFMASWCPACQAEMPELVEWLEGGGLPDEVELVSVSTSLDDQRDNWPPQAWFEREGYGEAVLVDDAEGSVARAYGLTATPFWAFIAGDGTVAGRVAGRMSPEQLQQVADQLATASR